MDKDKTKSSHDIRLLRKLKRYQDQRGRGFFQAGRSRPDQRGGRGRGITIISIASLNFFLHLSLLENLTLVSHFNNG